MRVFQLAFGHIERRILVDLLIIDGRRKTDEQFITIVIKCLPWILGAEGDAGFADGRIALPIDKHAHVYFFFLLLKSDGLCKRMLADKTIDRYVKQQRSLLHHPYTGWLVGTGYELFLLAEITFDFIEAPCAGPVYILFVVQLLGDEAFDDSASLGVDNESVQIDVQHVFTL